VAFEPYISSLDQLVRTTDQLVNENLSLFDAWGGAVDLRHYPIVYRPEPRRVNVFQNVADIINSGVADCEDLAAWLKAFYEYQGIPALIRFEQQSPTLYHVTNRVMHNGRMIRLDPSRWFGMRGKAR